MMPSGSSQLLWVYNPYLLIRRIMKQMDEDFIQGRDYAFFRGYNSYREFVKVQSMLAVNQQVIGKAWLGGESNKKVKARIDFERWIVDCPSPICDGAEVVDMADPIFFCCSCGNPEIEGKTYVVIFPDKAKRAKIYGELNKRPLVRPKTQGRVRSAEMSRPLYPGLGRSWHHKERVEDLQEQRRKVKEARPELYPVEKEYHTPGLPPNKKKGS